MTQHHKISEYIENLEFKKNLGGGVNPDDVYEAIRELTSMYNDVLAEAYQEVSNMRETLEAYETTPIPPPAAAGLSVTPPAPAANYGPPLSALAYEEPALPDPVVAPPVYETPTTEAPACAAAEAKGVTSEKGGLTAGDLRRMNRRRLLELLLECSRENVALKQENTQLQEQHRTLQRQLEDKRVKIEKAGTLAEAALMLNGVIESTQAAAAHYLDNLKDLEVRETIRCQEKEALTQRRARQIMESTRVECDELVRRTQEQCSAMEAQTRTACDSMTAKARMEIDGHWTQLSDRLESFYTAHEGLKEVLRNIGHLPGGGYG